jgi:hypothetical protein
VQRHGLHERTERSGRPALSLFSRRANLAGRVDVVKEVLEVGVCGVLVHHTKNLAPTSHPRRWLHSKPATHELKATLAVQRSQAQEPVQVTNASPFLFHLMFSSVLYFFSVLSS